MLDFERAGPISRRVLRAVLGPPVQLDGPHLRCPHCGGLYLHQGAVEIFNRAEDAELTHVVVVHDQVHDCAAPSCVLKNPSSRRQGMRVHFECEQCGPGLVLGISQHKGVTHVEWVEP